MPPKGAQKVKAQPAKTPKESPQTPKKVKSEQPKQEVKSASPKKVKEPVVYNRLATEKNAVIPVNVSFEGGTEHAKLMKSGSHAHMIKLEASAAFTLVKTLVFTEGPHEGQQAIIIRPAKAFHFLKLPKELRVRIYDYYLAPKGAAISIEGKRANKDLYAKNYAEGSKNRVALLAVSKEVHDDATPMLYANNLKLESSSALLEFLTQLPPSVRLQLRKLTLKFFVKTTAKVAMQILAEAHNLESIRFENGVFGEDDPVKAAKYFDGEARKFLLTIGAVKGSNDAAVDILHFGPAALTFKDAEKNVKNWSPMKVEDFKNKLRKRLLEG